MKKLRLTEQQIWLLEQLKYGTDPDFVLFRQLTTFGLAWVYETGHVQAGGRLYKLNGTPRAINRRGIDRTVSSLETRSILSSVGRIDNRTVLIVSDIAEEVIQLRKAKGVTCSN